MYGRVLENFENRIDVSKTASKKKASRKAAIKNHVRDPEKPVGGGSGSSRSGRQRRGEDVIHPMKVSLDDLYNGTSKNLSLTLNVLCSKCKGKGSKPGASLRCKSCKGYGRKTLSSPSCFHQVVGPCDDCKGTGKSENNSCIQCKGDKVSHVHKDFQVFVEKGMQNGQKITFPGAAHEAPGTVPGDVVFVLQLKKHPKFKRKGDDLFYEHTLSSSEALSGFQFAITHLDSRQLLINSDPGQVISPDKDEFKEINDEGMPMYQSPNTKGKLYIHFSVDFPNCSKKRKPVVQEHELYQEDILLKAPKVMSFKGGCAEAIRRGVPVYLPFEIATGYALFRAHGYDDELGMNFESTEEYIKLYNQVFTLVDFHPFKSASDALFHMKAISRFIVTEEMRSLLLNNLGEPDLEDHKYYIAEVGSLVTFATKMPSVGCGPKTKNVMRGLRMNICKFINGLQPAELEKAQRDLALSYSREMLERKKNSRRKQNKKPAAEWEKGLRVLELNYFRERQLGSYEGNSVKATISSSSPPSSNDVVKVVPHKMEGVFIAMRKNRDVICTKNLVPGEVVYGEELISVKDENGVEVEYRVWNPLESKLAAAIVSGVNNIWVKPGSRVLCMGDVRGVTVSHLSDIVGSNGLVYALAKSVVALNMAEKRSNLIPICVDFCGNGDVPVPTVAYRMLLSMVDTVCADTYHPEMLGMLNAHCGHYLKTGGHYLVSTKANGVTLSSQGGPMLRFFTDSRPEHKIIELVKLKQIKEQVIFMAVGEYRTQLNGPVQSVQNVGEYRAFELAQKWVEQDLKEASGIYCQRFLNQDYHA